MRIVSVNVGLPRQFHWNGNVVETGIFKEPVEGTVEVKRLNLQGDRQSDLTVHGGVNKAVYGYPSEHYEYWQKELPNHSLAWGNFGENLTTEGLDEENLHIGDRLKVGSAVFTVTQPRLPCYKLTIRFDRDDMIKRFLASGRSGFYFSVQEPGELSVDSDVEILSRDTNRVSLGDIQRLYLGLSRDKDLLHRALNLEALPESWKNSLKEKRRDD